MKYKYQVKIDIETIEKIPIADIKNFIQSTLENTHIDDMLTVKYIRVININ